MNFKNLPVWEKLGVIGSIASIIALILWFFPNPNQTPNNRTDQIYKGPDIKRDNGNSKIVIPPRHESPIPPLPSTYRQLSDVSGQTWSFTLDGRDIRVDFYQNNSVRFSDPILGTDGRWNKISRNSIKIETSSRTITGTFTTDGESMNTMVYLPGSSVIETSGLIFRRIH
jgi:hypothetical protein